MPRSTDPETEIDYDAQDDLDTIYQMKARVRSIVRPESLPTQVHLHFRSGADFDAVYADPENWSELCDEVEDEALRKAFLSLGPSAER